ncbi:sugar phosphate isomerase/epimerase family protein [Natronobiforma cellulositropha]|uniref:sugar phosphate isomerase/epimerase family protein n=1 Tax=Natronobiforma cellulositropha TaxID=1679076 RepID=UPI0021D57CC7|nr:sugar phosphate isomerase/epimerase family protein [Natronobiforma cellulositropha]
MAGHTFVVSGFADEIDADLETQLDLLERLGIEHLDLRSVENTNVLDLSDEQVERVTDALAERDIGVTSIGSPIGKIDVTDEFEPHFERFETALEMAQTFETAYIRLFSYYIPENERPADYREEVLRRTRRKVERAEAVGITLLHENEKDIYGDTPERCRDLLTAIDSPNFRAVFDPANFLEIGSTPYPDALLQLVEFVDQLHIKDATAGERASIVPAGEGDGRIPETLAALQARGFEGPVSLEPHLAIAGAMSGYSGPEGYEVGAKALVDCLEAVEATSE